ncbi:hypothetical protein V1514DRAFT_361819 [Lipomyces japonicus]|uniref:uncharacterized protein n=1 Tax=Lipomyces japonicus TaxID=56871 RepID=UPI0034CF4B5C
MSTPAESHPLERSDTASEDQLSDAPGSPIITDFLDTNQNGIGEGETSAAIDPLEYDEEGGDESDSLLHPQPRRARGRGLFQNSILTGQQQRAPSPTYSDDSEDSATEADLLLPSPSSASSLKSYFKRRWGSLLTRFLAYTLFGIGFILAFKLVFLPRTTLRRDLSRLRHYQVSLTDLERQLFDIPDESSIRDWSNYYTSGPHLAGKNISQALWTDSKFTEYGFKSEIVSYPVYLNYPVDHNLVLLGVNGTVRYVAPLVEDVLPEDPTTGHPESIPTFHGYSANGNVTGPYVYVNYGRQEDYNTLEYWGISLEGKIVIARYGGLFRGLIVKGAQERGAIGVLIYSDPGDDGKFTEANHYKAYPDGPARHPSSVQRGSVEFLSLGPGDPTTPGYASKPGVPREDPQKFLPSIPSIPISYRDVLPILEELNGMGLNPNDLGESWRGGLRSFDYSVGPSTMDLNLHNEQEYKITPLWNVIARLDGIIRDEVIILGNHRDAWIVGGAGDPNSGSAVLIELAKAFGELKKKGWKPLRTIILASWDGEEYGLIGSTEWGEELAKYLGANTLTYLNVDVAVAGTKFGAAASPLLNEVLVDVLKRVAHPKGGFVYDHWVNETGGHISTLGSGSDYTVFQDHLGIPSVDIGFSGGEDAPVYQYHSNYDSFHWMDKFGDPTWAYHATMVKIWGLLTLQLSEYEIVKFNIKDYAVELSNYVDRIRQKIDDVAREYVGTSISQSDGHYECPEVSGTVIRECQFMDYSKVDVKDFDDDLGYKLGWWYVAASLKATGKAADELLDAATRFEEKSKFLKQEYIRDYPWFKSYKKMRLYFQIQAINDQYQQFERKLLHDGGLDGREWFKHVVYAPGIWTGYAGAVLPGIDEAIDNRNITNTKRWLDIVAERLVDATTLLTQY